MSGAAAIRSSGRCGCAAGMRTGYGKPRRLSLTAGPITVRRPRVRGLAERFVSRVLPTSRPMAFIGAWVDDVMVNASAAPQAER
jgi:hypothetical protein